MDKGGKLQNMLDIKEPTIKKPRFKNANSKAFVKLLL